MGCCQKPVTEGHLNIGDTAPDFCLPGTDGKEYKLEDFKGKKAFVVSFWCNHCPYVIKSENRMIDLANKYTPKDVGFAMINANDVVNYPQDNFDNMKRRATDKEYPFPYLFNDDQTIPKAYGGTVTPHIFVFDGDFKLCYSGAIDDNLDNADAVKVAYLKNALDAILEGNTDKIEQKETQPRGCSIKWKS